MQAKSALRIVFALLLAIAVPGTIGAFAQKTTGTEPSGHVMPKYDSSKEVKIKGTIEEVKEMTAGKEVGVHLMVKTSSETIEVRLCPSGYLKDFEVAFSKGQTVEVTGSKVKIEDKDVVLAREVVQGYNTVPLRDKQGTPVWTWLKKN